MFFDVLFDWAEGEGLGEGGVNVGPAFAGGTEKVGRKEVEVLGMIKLQEVSMKRGKTVRIRWNGDQEGLHTEKGGG